MVATAECCSSTVSATVAAIDDICSMTPLSLLDRLRGIGHRRLDGAHLRGDLLGAFEVWPAAT
jgi:hypothetical protein